MILSTLTHKRKCIILIEVFFTNFLQLSCIQTLKSPYGNTTDSIKLLTT